MLTGPSPLQQQRPTRMSAHRNVHAEQQRACRIRGGERKRGEEEGRGEGEERGEEETDPLLVTPLIGTAPELDGCAG
eukprot:2941901-Rhodomonas_salina.2